jgi:hypothetical protein
LPQRERYAGVMENFNTHGSVEVGRVVARWGGRPLEPPKLKTGPQRRALLWDPSHRHVFHGTPNHGAWLHQAALFFGV